MRRPAMAILFAAAGLLVGCLDQGPSNADEETTREPADHTEIAYACPGGPYAPSPCREPWGLPYTELAIEVAVDPQDPKHVFVISLTQGDLAAGTAAVGRSWLAVHESRDAGASWVRSTPPRPEAALPPEPVRVEAVASWIEDGDLRFVAALSAIPGPLAYSGSEPIPPTIGATVAAWYSTGEEWDVQTIFESPYQISELAVHRTAGGMVVTAWPTFYLPPETQAWFIGIGPAGTSSESIPAPCQLAGAPLIAGESIWLYCQDEDASGVLRVNATAAGLPHGNGTHFPSGRADCITGAFAPGPSPWLIESECQYGDDDLIVTPVDPRTGPDWNRSWMASRDGSVLPGTHYWMVAKASVSDARGRLHIIAEVTEDDLDSPFVGNPTEYTVYHLVLNADPAPVHVAPLALREGVLDTWTDLGSEVTIARADLAVAPEAVWMTTLQGVESSLMSART